MTRPSGSMPNDLILVRHGESVGNVVTNNAKNGDLSGYTESFMTTPGHQWRLTDLGRRQAVTIGHWIENWAFPGIYWGVNNDHPRFDRFYVSPYVRALETAAHMGLSLGDRRWFQNRALRERDWGDIGSMPRKEFEKRYPDSALMKRIDPLYWVAPNGESQAQVAEDRVRNFLDTLARECTGKRVVAVLHGETARGFQLVLERMTDAQFMVMDADSDARIRNCEAIHWTRRNPETGEIASSLRWVRRAYPTRNDTEPNGLIVCERPWREIVFPTFTNEDLMAHVDQVPFLLPQA